VGSIHLNENENDPKNNISFTCGSGGRTGEIIDVKKSKNFRIFSPDVDDLLADTALLCPRAEIEDREACAPHGELMPINNS